MKRLMILCLIFFVAACAQHGAERQTAFQEVAPETLQRSAQVKVTLGQEKLELGKSPEEQLWKRAERKGVRKAVQPWIEKGYLIRPSRANVLDEGFSRFHKRKGEFAAQAEEITQVFSKRFDIRVTLTPVKQLSGTIASIEADRNMAAANFQVGLELEELTPDKNGAYFIVVQMDTALEDSEQGKIVASGHIYRTLDNKAQAQLLDSKREIQPGDLVFLLRTEVSPVSTQKDEEKEESEEVETQPSKPEVMVEPKKEERGPELPEETK
jgi:hypothetical protein